MAETYDPNLLPRVCRSCGTGLRALPESGRCPRCGTEYQAGTYVWAPRLSFMKKWGFYLFFIGGISLLLLIATVADVAGMILSGKSHTPIIGSGSVVLSIVIGFILVRTRAQRTPQAIVVEPGGIRYCLQVDSKTKTTTEKFVPWNQVIKVSPRKYDLMCVLDFAGPSDLVGPPGLTVTFFKTPAEVSAFAGLINERIAASAAKATSKTSEAPSNRA